MEHQEEEPLEWIEWDDLEQAFFTNHGETYKSFEDIPEEHHDIVRPISQIPTHFRGSRRKSMTYHKT